MFCVTLFLDDIAKLHLFGKIDGRKMYQITMFEDFFMVAYVTFNSAMFPKMFVYC